tara:strand:- start:4146 stop:4706 length:561 start_codon:yes stop_codon:yes gene_type:complete
LEKFSLDKDSSIQWLEKGKILVHPTESIWGLGCDAFNENAINKIFKLKKRNKNKGFILLVKSLDSIQEYLYKLSLDDKEYLNRLWPGPYTFLIKYNERLPKHLRNETAKIAIRVSNHLPIKNLFKGFDRPIISTSANISGQEIINNPQEVINFFECDEVAYYDEMLGENNSPSQIIDLDSKDIIRA